MAGATVQDVKELPAILSVEQMRQLLGVSRPKAYELVHTQGFPVVRLGRAIRIPREALMEWIGQQSGHVVA